MIIGLGTISHKSYTALCNFLDKIETPSNLTVPDFYILNFNESSRKKAQGLIPKLTIGTLVFTVIII